MYRINQIKINYSHSEREFRDKIAKAINVYVEDIDWSKFIILRKSIDARDKGNILFVYNVAFDFVDGFNKSKGFDRVVRYLEKYEPIKFNPILSGSQNSPLREGLQCSIRPVVVGFGPAGIFASYILALNGLKPIVIERGKKLDERIKDVDRFFDTMELAEASNVCFGEGGAGAFSDGKLNTNNKDHKGLYRFVLETFVKFGADEKILYENLPHIGTDKLVDVIKNIRNEIVRLGGEIHYETKLCFKDGLAMLAPTGDGLAMLAPTGDGFAVLASTNDRIVITKDTPIILAIGNSSRDTFKELYENGFDIKAKPIAVGYRIAHKQSFINKSQYGEKTCVNNKLVDALGPAVYKLTYDVGNGHSVYSFCMCPGGYIINSSNAKGHLSINGMSYNDRSGVFANSAIVETISPDDLKGSQSSPVQSDSQSSSAHSVGASSASAKKVSPLVMLELQEKIEKAAFELEKGYIPYVTSSKDLDVDEETIFKGRAKYCEKLKTVYENLGIEFSINDDIEKALKYFDKIIPGFFAGSQCSPLRETGSQYVLAGVETRTSSPVKLERDENYMCNVKNYYPCGEGLGHGGGIMSCAVDGINVAMKIVEKLTTIYSG